MASTIQIKRGLRVNIPSTAANGELVFTTDDQQLSVGNTTGTAVIPIKIAAANVTGLVNGGTELVNAQTGTTYTVVVGDAGKLLTMSNAAAVAVTQPIAGFTSGFYYDIENKGVGDVTITTTGSTINGAATFILHTNQGMRVVYDGTNWQVMLGRAVVAKSAVGSQWLNSVGADGAFTSTQPAFTDVSGTVASGQLPTPTTTTFGGVKDVAAVATKFVSAVTNGVPILTQPAFTDISGVLDGGTF
jgi:Major tropism determinant N-terminal domain